MGEDLILPDQVDSTQAAPGAGLYQPQEFRIPVGPIFNFVTGEQPWTWGLIFNIGLSEIVILSENLHFKL